jgi:hypothetical protein
MQPDIQELQEVVSALRLMHTLKGSGVQVCDVHARRGARAVLQSGWTCAVAADGWGVHHIKVLEHTLHHLTQGVTTNR